MPNSPAASAISRRCWATGWAAPAWRKWKPCGRTRSPKNARTPLFVAFRELAVDQRHVHSQRFRLLRQRAVIACNAKLAVVVRDIGLDRDRLDCAKAGTAEHSVHGLNRGQIVPELGVIDGIGDAIAGENTL